MSDHPPRSADELGLALARLSDEERASLEALGRQLVALGKAVKVPDARPDEIWKSIEESLDADDATGDDDVPDS
jgi:hypothetical protein